ncbi:hypothetical protein NIES806_20940 [Dolichospermum compactum NIES-806]|uniref:Uncharacterized protein n=1 Tax=Dolichospermum compactum NIES-806 TaxID=1973481 RepID=A0A1Z4V2Y7_9CYAN|nr:hypothetical protein NIES806_20940 [Dolichospermum compactum NIES-806]
MRLPIFENIKRSNPVSVRVLGIFYRKYHKGSGRAIFYKITIIIKNRPIKELGNSAIWIEDFDGFFLVLITANFYLLSEFVGRLQRVF